MTDAGIRKPRSRARKIIADGEETTNGDIERILNNEAKKLERFLGKTVKEWTINHERPAILPRTAALTDYNRKREAVREYRFTSRRKYIIEDDFEHLLVPKESIYAVQNCRGEDEESFVHLSEDLKLKKTST